MNDWAKVKHIPTYHETRALKAMAPAFCGGTVVIGKVVKNCGAHRSSAIQALRIVEAAGYIETQSMGRSGTHIKVLWPGLVDAIEAM